eukprot:8840908-Ditylum_brightwellii.AAC.1
MPALIIQAVNEVSSTLQMQQSTGLVLLSGMSSGGRDAPVPTNQNSNVYAPIFNIPIVLTDIPTAASYDSLPNNHIPLSDDSLISMTKAAFQHELHMWGGGVSGNKEALINRLRKALEKKSPVISTPQKNQKRKKENSISTGFPSTTYWGVLDTDDDAAAAEDPSNLTFKFP